MKLNIRRYIKRKLGHVTLLLPVVVFLFSACDNYPQDLQNTLKKAEDGTLLVGYTENPPWVIKSEKELAGIEVEIVKAFAKSINAEIEWIGKNEQTLLDELEHHNLHLVIAGLTRDDPWQQRVGLTNPYIVHEDEAHVLAVPPGELAFLYTLEKFLNTHEQGIKKTFNQYTNYEEIEE